MLSKKAHLNFIPRGQWQWDPSLVIRRTVYFQVLWLIMEGADCSRCSPTKLTFSDGASGSGTHWRMCIYFQIYPIGLPDNIHVINRWGPSLTVYVLAGKRVIHSASHTLKVPERVWDPLDESMCLRSISRSGFYACPF